MKLSVSTLAWEPMLDGEVRSLLSSEGISGLEVVPSRYWPSAPDVREAEIAEFRARWADAGVSVVAMQSLLFNMPHHQLFGGESERVAFESHVIGMTRLAGALGAQAVVIGAPKNRRRGNLAMSQAIEIAVPVFRRIADAASDAGVVAALEPIPARYGSDFIQTTAEALSLVAEVSHDGFGLQFDASTTAINHEADSLIEAAARIAAHFHISEIDLVTVGAGSVDHRRLGQILASASYANWHSIEMLPVAPEETVTALQHAIRSARSSYDWRSTAQHV